MTCRQRGLVTVQGRGDTERGRRGEGNQARIETPPDFRRPNQRFGRGVKTLGHSRRTARELSLPKLHVPRRTVRLGTLRVPVSERLRVFSGDW